MPPVQPITAEEVETVFTSWVHSAGEDPAASQPSQSTADPLLTSSVGHLSAGLQQVARHRATSRSTATGLAEQIDKVTPNPRTAPTERSLGGALGRG